MGDRRQPGLRDLRVVLRRVEARPHGANDLAMDDDRKAALYLGVALRRNGCNATVVDRVPARLARFLDQRSRSGLAKRKLHEVDWNQARLTKHRQNRCRDRCGPVCLDLISRDRMETN
jgi:hypothetical protein